MVATTNAALARRSFLAGTAAAGLLALPGCSSMGGLSMVDAVRRLLEISSGRALSKLTAADGFWNSSVARIGLPEMFGNRGNVVQSILTSGVFRDRLQKSLNNVAEAGARRAAPVVTEAVRNIGIENAIGIIRGGPTAATSFLRSAMGPAVLNAMVPGLTDALRVANDPIVNQAISALARVNISDVAQSVSIGAENGLWNEIGLAEGDIRRNPEQTNDAVLIAALKGASIL